MNLIGIWEGVWYLLGLRPFMEDEPFQLEILSISDEEIFGKVKEAKSSKGIKRENRNKRVSYPVSGSLEGNRITLTGTDKEKICLELVLLDGSLKGDYYFASKPGRRATVELKKHPTGESDVGT